MTQPSVAHFGASAARPEGGHSRRGRRLIACAPLPDVAFGGEAWALLRLTIDASVVPAPTAHAQLLNASVSWRGSEAGEHGSHAQAFSLPVLPAGEVAALAEDPLVRRRLAEVTVARLQQDAHRAARRRDWAAVEEALRRAREASASNPWLSGVVEELEALAALRDEEMLAKESMYASRRAMSRLAVVRESAGLEDEGDVPAFARRKRVQGRAGSSRGVS